MPTPSSDAASPMEAAAPRRSWLDAFLSNGGMVILLLVVAVVCTALAEPRFLNRMNLINLGRNFSFLLIPAMAQTLVMTVGGFDLSVGMVAAAGSVVSALTMGAVAAWMPGADLLASGSALLAVLAVGLVVGLTNALLVAQFALSPFMVTLAVMSILTGIALYYTQGIPVYGVLDSFVEGVGRGQIAGIPVILLIALAILAACVVLQRLTVFGRHVYAVGSDERAARLSGVRTRRVLIITYAIAGVLAALTGYLMTARIGSGQATIGGTMALETIAAAVIGGVSLRGGVGRVELVALAALFLAVIANAMNLLQLDSKYQTLVLGVVLILALGMERLLLRSKDQ
ncbi:MAG: ABC transporter permease [Fuscovulum sp.]|jgi:ribose transport system permease protein|nr:ABC transporter permease [Fuscovulum sp.]